MMATATYQSRKISRDETAQLAKDGPPTHLAILNKDVTALQKLVQSGASHYNSKNRETALHVAARSGSVQCLQWLIDNRIGSPMEKDSNGSTCCHYAAVYGNMEILEVLLRDCSSPHTRFYNSVASIDARSKAQERNSCSTRRERSDGSLSGHPARYCSNCVCESAPLFIGDIKMVEFVVDKFPSLGEISDTGGTLPIHFAAAGGKRAMVTRDQVSLP